MYYYTRKDLSQQGLGTSLQGSITLNCCTSHSPGCWCVVQLDLLHKGSGDGIPTAQQVTCHSGDLWTFARQEVHLACV